MEIWTSCHMNWYRRKSLFLKSSYLNSWSTVYWALSRFLWFDIFAVKALLRTKQPQQGSPVQRHNITVTRKFSSMDQVKPTLIKPKQWPGSPLPHCIIQSSRSYHKGIELRRARLELRLTLPYTQMNRAGFTVSASWIHLTHNPEKEEIHKDKLHF